MTVSVLHVIGPNGGHTMPKGTRPSKPVRWEVSAWLTLPTGEKTIHAFTVASALMFDLVPLVNERVDELIQEVGDLVIGAGWLAHGRGAPKPKKKRKK
jgi:hypothetical protein